MTAVDCLSTEDVLTIIAAHALGGPPQVRDFGLLDAAVNRPRATVFGQDAYPDLCTKAAALLHSVASNHPLVDGNKRLAWHSAVVFLALNGLDVAAATDDAYTFVMSVAAGELAEVDKIADWFRSSIR